MPQHFDGLFLVALTILARYVGLDRVAAAPDFEGATPDIRQTVWNEKKVKLTLVLLINKYNSINM